MPNGKQLQIMESPTFERAIAYIPECRPDILSPAWFDWLKGIGYTGIYIENDPFKPARSGNASQFDTLYRLISLYDLAWGPERQRLRDWIGRACELAHERDMQIYLALWEPRVPAEAWGLFPGDWRGRGGWDRPPWNHISWCLSVPEAVRAFEDMATEAFRAVPDIDGLKMGTHDNDACLCNEQCPRCAGVGRAELTRRVFAALTAAADRSGLHRPGFEYALYTWWWQAEELAAVVPLFDGRDTSVISRSTFGLKQYWQGRELGACTDLALGLPGVSEFFRNERRQAAERGWKLFDMAAWGHSLEYFWLPYTPAPNRVAERLFELRELGASGWFDYDCGGVYPGINTEIIRGFQHGAARPPQTVVADTLAQLYAPAEREAAAEAYALAEQALALRPVAFDAPDVRNMPGRCTIECVIGLPFDPGMISGLDQGHRVWFFTPANFMTPDAIPTLLAMFTACSDAWEEADQAFVRLQGRGEWAGTVLPWEKTVVRAHRLCAGSVVRFIRMAANRLARGAGEIGAEAERDRLLEIYDEEIAAPRECREFWITDRRLLANSNIRLEVFLQACVPWIPLNPNDPFQSKIAWMQAEQERLRTAHNLDAVPRLTKLSQKPDDGRSIVTVDDLHIRWNEVPE